MQDKMHIHLWHQRLDTPALIIHMPTMQRNLFDMQQVADRSNLILRPHCKTHKSPQLAQRQQTLGAQGITVSKLSEAEVMVDGGLSDIFIANQITQHIKLRRLKELHKKATITIGIDHLSQIQVLKNQFTSASHPLQLRIEIDCGFGRCGVAPGTAQLLALAKEIQRAPGLLLDGLFTHAGQAYSAPDVEQIREIARDEANAVVEAGERIREIGIEVATLSVGSTPTAKFIEEQTGITEFRPGNYIFYDAIQVGLGVVRYAQCALYVLATVISKPSSDRIVCDAGSKALNLDRGAHSAETVEGHGYLVNIRGTIDRVSEEHGMIQMEAGQDIKIGDPLLIVPNHACAVVNLYDAYNCVEADGTVQTMPISGRGKSQ